MRARTRCARGSTSSTTTTRSRFRERFAARMGFHRSANFLAGTYNASGFTQTFGETVVSQTNPNVGVLRAGRVEGEPLAHDQRRVALRHPDAGDDRHRPQQRLTAVGFCVDAGRIATNRRSRQRRAVLRPCSTACARQRAAVGGQYDRSDAAAPAWYQPVAVRRRGRLCSRISSPPPCRRSRS